MSRTKTRKPEPIRAIPLPKIPDLNYRKMSNQDIRRFIYDMKLAWVFCDRHDKEVRQASRTELANFCQQLYQEQCQN